MWAHGDARGDDLARLHVAPLQRVGHGHVQVLVVPGVESVEPLRPRDPPAASLPSADDLGPARDHQPVVVPQSLVASAAM